MNSIKRLIGLIRFREALSYVAVSVVAYGMVFLLMYIFAELLRLNSQAAFFLTYTLAYVFDYFANLKVVFRSANGSKVFGRYLIYLALFFGLANALFWVLGGFGIGYFAATILTLVLLFPLRFFWLRTVVYRS